MNWRMQAGADPALSAAVEALAGDAPNAHFTQHPAWSAVPADDGGGSWLHFTGERDGRVRVAALVRLRRAPLLGYSLADVFRGPMADSPESLVEGLRALEESLSAYRPLAIRVDPFWSGSGFEEVRSGLAGLGYAPMQDPPWSRRTIEVDIDRDPEPMLRTFRRDTRYDVRRAVKLRLDVREDLDDEGLDRFEELYRAMVATKGAHPRPAGFFRAVRDHFRAWPRCGFFLASWLGPELLGAIAVFTLGRRAIYGYGASGSGHPGVPRTHLLQFTAMQHARRRGCSIYDMGGFGAGAGEASSRTPVQRVNYFKIGFGGREVDFVGGHEKILRPVVFGMLRAAHRAIAARRRDT